MKQQNPPSSEDLSALEEYYRKQLLEYQKQASLPTQSVKTAAPSDPVQTPRPPQPRLNPNPPVLQPEQQIEQPKQQSTPQIEQPERQPAPQNGQRGSGMAQTEALPPEEKREIHALQSGAARQERLSPALPTPGAGRSGVLPRVSPILRPAPVVPPQRIESPARQGIAPSSEGQQDAFGWIKVNVTTASQAVPVAGAVVLIEKVENDRRILIDQMTTDGSGNTPQSKPLATVPASESLTPNGIGAPYTVYEVRVAADGFATYRAPNVLVFAGETSLIDADMIPLRETMDFS